MSPDYMNTWFPAIEVESSNGIHDSLLLNRLLTERKIFLHGEITDATANDFVTKMLYFAREKAPVDIYLNSPGGSVNAGLVIYDLIQQCDFPVRIYCTGMAASMGAVILAGGQEGARFILPHSKVMIHEPLLAGGVNGSASSIEKTAESILETKRVINELLARHSHKTVAEINEATAFDNYMNADEAIAFGLCDQIANILQDAAERSSI
jgi:ATP-dependent Clp protease protease subunit